MKLSSAKRHIQLLRGLGAIAMIGTGGVSLSFIVLMLWIPIANSDFRARTRSNVTVVSEGTDNLTAALVLHRLVPEENAAEASLILTAYPGSALDSIRADPRSFRFTLRNRFLVLPLSELQSISFDSIPAYQNELTSVRSERFMLPLYSSVTDFPWDYYVGFVGAEVEQTSRGFVPATVVIVKEFPGWTIVSEGIAENLTLRLERPLVQRIVVLLSLMVYLLLSLWVVVSIVRGPKELSAISGSTALAGFILAAAGYREIVGLSALPSASWLDLVVLGVPLIALLAGMLAYFRKHHQENE